MSDNGKKVGSVLVVGGGVAGMQAALDCANSGFKVYLLEKEPAIGGNMARLDKTFPTNDCAMCMISPKLVETGRHPNIEIISYSDLKKVQGEVGNFTVTVNRRSRYVDEDKCTGCKKCMDRCYFEAIEFKEDPENPERVKAAVIPESCKGCGLCIITCKPNALRYEIVRPPEYLKPKPLKDGEEPPPFPVWGHYFLK